MQLWPCISITLSKIINYSTKRIVLKMLMVENKMHYVEGMVGEKMRHSGKKKQADGGKDWVVTGKKTFRADLFHY